MFFKKEKVEAFSKITITMRGMRAIDEYEVINNGDTSEVSQYQIYYTKREDRSLMKRASLNTKEFIELLNKCNIIKWDGFIGNNPPGVRDGYMFTFLAEVNDGRIIKAEGSNNYPSHFNELRQRLIKILYEE